jgi:hypothetical protein
MRPEPLRPDPPPREVAEPAPLVIGFGDLFDALGTAELRYSDRARGLSGRAVVIDGFLSRPHVPLAAPMLVDQPGVCPDCSPVPAAVIALPGFGAAPLFQAASIDDGSPGDRPVRIVGRLDFGFRIADGTASMLRIEHARVEPR